MQQRISTKRIIYNLLNVKDQVLEHFKGEERYQKLLIYLTEKDYLNDNNISLPTFKEIEQHTGIKTYHIRKQLNDMYAELFDMEKDFQFNFNKCVIYFNIKYLDNYTAIKCKNLTHLPRIGENIDLPFVKAKVGCDFFYVDDIRHGFNEKKQTIDIFLKCGMFNSFWHHRLHEAKEKRELPFQEFYELSDYELKKRLGL